MKESRTKFLREFKSFLFLALMIFSFRSMCFEPFRIPSGSMIPTLNIGDFIVVNKMSYGVKLPFSDVFTDPVYLMNFDKPKRGDVVVFKYPNDTSLDYIKRVIGLPGDVIEMRDKVVFINGEPLKVKQAPSSKVYEQMVEEFKKYNLDHYRSKLGDKNFSLLLSDNRTRGDNIAPFTVPDGQYFVLGDNRDFSMDSRYWGFVPFENIKGKALFVWLSVTNPFGEYSFKFRPDRTGVLL